MSFNEMFRVLRREYILKYGDDEEFKVFKNNFEIEFDKKENEMFNKVITSQELWEWIYEKLYSQELLLYEFRLKK